ncbi:Rv3654c family TadE-like protein [Paeniglutamicibacter cryotolerans]|uniref:Secretion/DNA translocation related TadE-like protein n=1 Tax=Paeniglutamicibacter cryotolerans TaxID=670079 RepID=A0A839QQ73_9MICC|nr:Rv3654c family TadE-like protein [Paeniglutamicibacter cryotolerans]MBB2994231.1 secretion/DNA translocation related TadE-like protein [Paeniglutamicibacter cryotolerans]
MRRGRTGYLGAEHGAGTALVAGLVALILMGIVAVLAVGAAAEAGARAGTAADLAALAGADAARGITAGEPCSVAAATAVRNGARIAGCRRSGAGGSIVEVSVLVSWGGAFSGLGELHGTSRARAGPPASPWTLPGHPASLP